MASQNAYAAISSFLRPSEELKCLLEARHEILDQDSTSSAAFTSTSTHIIAIITHQNARTGMEEGCVMILSSTNAVYASGALAVDHAYPLVKDLSISMTQTRRKTLDLSVKTMLVNQSRSEFYIKITPPERADHHESFLPSLTLVTADLARLKEVLAEARRLIEISGKQTNESEPPLSYPWISFYTTERDFNYLLSPTPLDLRRFLKPIHNHLSKASAGLPGDDVGDMHIVRDDWIRRQARQACRTGLVHDLRVRIGTFNVNGKTPSQDLTSWVRGRTSSFSSPAPGNIIPPLKPISPLSLGEIKDPIAMVDTTPKKPKVDADQDNVTKKIAPTAFVDDGDDFDMLVLGFQELDLSAEALLISTSTAREEQWTTAVIAGLGEKGVLYEKLASKQLVGMLLMIFVKKSLRVCFSDIKVTAVGAGIMGIMGNKGGNAIRLAFAPPGSADESKETPIPTILTFVNAHLAAFEDMQERRNSDYHDLSKRLLFDAARTANTPYAEPSVSALSIYDTDVLFWMGDLNYRIELPDEDVREILAQEQDSHNLMLRYDQLRTSIRKGHAFEGFEEMEITHMPTYRFASGLLVDQLGYDKKRKPAWTDRILYMASPGAPVAQLQYTSHPEITFSDHRPLSASFVVKVPGLDKTVHESTVHRLYRRVSDMDELEDNPRVQLSTSTIELGKLEYLKPVSQKIEVENFGSVPAVLRFVPMNDGGDIHPKWLSIQPVTGILLPQDKLEITLSAYVDSHTAADLNLKDPQLECMLILHTALSKDHFIVIKAEYTHTCFANSLSTLIRLPGPIRDVYSDAELAPLAKAINAPREVMRLVNWMMSHAAHVPGLFLTSASEEHVQTIRECLDTGTDFPFLPEKVDDGIRLAFGETLRQLLSSLTEPVVPYILHAQCAQATNREEAFEILETFPAASVNVWISVTAFLHFVSQQHEPTTEDRTQHNPIAEKLASVFAPILLPDDVEGNLLSSNVSPSKKRRFLLFFLCE